MLCPSFLPLKLYSTKFSRENIMARLILSAIIRDIILALTFGPSFYAN